MKATIYHNPGCSTSRKALALLREAPGIELSVVEYLKHPPSRDKLGDLYRTAGITPRQGMRTRNTPAEALGLTAPGVPDDIILDAMVQHPALIERPLVETEKGVRLGRPLELVNEIL